MQKTVTLFAPRWLDASFSNIQSAWSKERDCCSLTHEIAPKAVFLENLLAVSSWILNGSSIEYHENKRQPFSLSVVRFESQAILISGWKSAWRWSGRKWAFHPCLLYMTSSTSQPKTHQIVEIRHFEPQKQQNTTAEEGLCLFWALT